MSETALHYTTAALEDLRHLHTRFRQRGNLPGSAVALGALVELMHEAVKFQLPDHGELVALTSLDEAFSEFIKLPFDAVCLEAPFPPNERATPVYDGDDAFKEALSSRRIAVAWTSDMHQRFAPLCKFGPRKGFYVTSVYYSDDSKHWLQSPLANFIPDNPGIQPNAQPHSEGFRGLEDAFLRAQNPGTNKAAMYDCEPVLLCDELAHMLATELDSVELALARLSLDIRDETCTALSFCLTVNASNVERRRIEAPVKLNKKRLAHQRVPFYDSWVLELGRKSTGAHAEGVEGAGPSGREAPRMHLRRGHLRRLGPERICFVRATTVGSPRQGVVDKSYRIPEPPAASVQR